MAGVAGAQDAATTTATATQDAPTTTSALPPCAELPKGALTEDELKTLAPDESPGRVRIGWKTESQDETYGFNILRANHREGPYRAINPAIIPGEGTTNVPKGYCFEDTTVKRGQTYFYQIEEVTNAGIRTIVEGTQGTMVKVKTVAEERQWLKEKADAAASAESQSPSRNNP